MTAVHREDFDADIQSEGSPSQSPPSRAELCTQPIPHRPHPLGGGSIRPSAKSWHKDHASLQFRRGRRKALS
ncbi:hypothetical protein M378DRAFT_159446 [Amanita muscaria Koide BX008]|uniref:Uncharacterized protein n=1 Tax=Amanita muscaria (strain Koide BX008) TaxID=946122 RepID=A0A0C2TKR7_AMAMK|nr:hypothetical protein M378DRAFT_159446 [Amanita muscaria Koide BX008]